MKEFISLSTMEVNNTEPITKSHRQRKHLPPPTSTEEIRYHSAERAEQAKQIRRAKNANRQQKANQLRQPNEVVAIEASLSSSSIDNGGGGGIRSDVSSSSIAAKQGRIIYAQQQNAILHETNSGPNTTDM
jgi:hypothetical protein